MFLCAVSQSTCFGVSYSGNLDRMLERIKVDEECAKYYRKTATIYASLSWVVLLINCVFIFFSMFFTGGYMDIMLAPIAVYVNLSYLVIPRVVVFLYANVYLATAWIFPHAMNFMLATIFAHQYRQLGRSFERRLADSDERQVSDSDIELLRQKHDQISTYVSKADDVLMFHNAGAFCCQLFCSILLLYGLIFHRSADDPVVTTVMRVFWLFGLSSGLCLTAAGGIMVHHYVSTTTTK